MSSSSRSALKVPRRRQGNLKTSPLSGGQGQRVGGGLRPFACTTCGILNRDLLGRLSRSSRLSSPVPASSLTHWISAAQARGRLETVVAGLYINRFRVSPGLLADAAHWLKTDAIISLNTVLGDAGIL